MGDGLTISRQIDAALTNVLRNGSSTTMTIYFIQNVWNWTQFLYVISLGYLSRIVVASSLPIFTIHIVKLVSPWAN